MDGQTPKNCAESRFAKFGPKKVNRNWAASTARALNRTFALVRSAGKDPSAKNVFRCLDVKKAVVAIDRFNASAIILRNGREIFATNVSLRSKCFLIEPKIY